MKAKIVNCFTKILCNFFIPCLIGLFLSFLLPFRPVCVSGSSMEPTLSDGDVLCGIKFSKNKECSYGDIVVIRVNRQDLNLEETLIKRIIGCPNDTIQITQSGEVIRNGEVLSEPYISEKILSGQRGDVVNITLRDGEYYVLGDNRNNSLDSRVIGAISEEEIIFLVE